MDPAMQEMYAQQQLQENKKIDMLQRINKYKNEALLKYYIFNCFGPGIDEEDLKSVFKYM